MKRAFWAAALVLGAVLGAAGTRAVAQGDGKPGPYEYRVFLVSAADFHDKDDWKETVARAGDEFHADPLFKERILNHFAEDGWELVQVVPLGGGAKEKGDNLHYYFRRLRSR